MTHNCDMCRAALAKQFQLMFRTSQKNGAPASGRGAGSIRLCQTCWRHVTAGHRYKRFPGRCAKGLHEMSGDNLLFHTDGHRVCRGCRRMANDAYNSKQRAKRAARGLLGRAWNVSERERHRETMRDWAARRAAA